METKRSSINRAVGRQLKREQAVSMSVKELARRTGISDATINRMWSKDPRDINITQITWLAALMGTTPQEIVERAINEVGGLGPIMADLKAALSDPPATTDDLKTRRDQREAEQMSTAEIEDIAIAATEDPERRNPEPSAT